MKFGLVVGLHHVHENVLGFLLLGNLVHKKQKDNT